MQFDDLGTWLQENQLLAATANLRWQVLLQRQLEKQPAQPVENLGEFLTKAQGEDLQPVEKIVGGILLKTPGWLSKKGVLQRLKLTTLLLQKNLGSQVFLNPFSTVSQFDHGITLRWQLPEFLLQQSYQEKFKSLQLDYLAYRAQVYLKIIQQLNNNSWLLPYLTGSTPATDGKMVKSSFWLRHFTQRWPADFQFMVQNFTDQHWQSLPFRPLIVEIKTKGGSRKVIGGIELQSLELDPFSPVGITGATLDLFQLLTTYFWLAPGLVNDQLTIQLKQAFQKAGQQAAANPFAAILETKTSLKLFNQLTELIEIAKFSSAEQLLAECQTWRQLFKDGTQTKSGQLLRLSGRTEIKTWQLAQKSLDKLTTSWQQHELADSNSLEVLAAALAEGKSYQLLSGTEHLIKIEGQLIGDGFLVDTAGNLTQRCWRDRLLASQLAAAAGFQIPMQWQIKRQTDFERLYPQLAASALAIKGRYQRSAWAFRLPLRKEQLWPFVKQILQQDRACLLQQMQAGGCYRILLVAQKPITIVERLPQQIVGDGRATLGQLIEHKQLLFKQQQRAFPFAKLQQQTIDDQGYQLTDILPRGVQLLLRYDSSSQTGEEYLEVSQEIDRSYLTAIKRLAAALGMKSGVLDVIIPNIYRPFKLQAADQLYFLSAHQTVDLNLLRQVKLGPRRPLGKLILEQLFANKK
ncbi:hypothetical protein [Liquorilactobacillus sicerae]|uniref:hypothetical protein n=1 Tax=Liquorilactobacillus sicerae TaxID=1416943 RepID=UPI0024813D77|nr:hypothetical protein [Liquorilactobacillus sicerae]